MPSAFPAFELRTLGTLSLSGPEGRPVDGVASAPRRVAVLTYLALHASRGMERRDTIVALFWPESPTGAARHSLHSVLYALRTKLPGVIVTRGNDEVGIDARLLRCDAAEFERAIAAQRLTHGLDLYAGEFLTGFHVRGAPGFGRWMESVRARLREHAVEAASSLARAALDAGDAAALAGARRAVELSGGREPQVRLLIEALAMAGDATEVLREYEALARRLREDHGVQPSVETESLVHRLRGAGTGADGSVSSTGGGFAHSPHPLPTPATPFIGREREIAVTAERLRESRLVTILGPGGVGKSRLALEVAGRAMDAYRDGVWFVPLSGLSSGDHLSTAIGATLRVPVAPGPTRARLFDYLAEKEMLLVLDNFEHLTAEGQLIAEILEASPDVRLLVTSRERLGVPAETLVELWGMEIPGFDTDDGWRRADALRLFVQAARRVDPDFALAREDLPHVAAICRFAGGFPLGIELTAAWVRLLTVREIAAELDAGSEPTATAGGLPRRLRSLRAAFEYSWERLADDERAVLARLSIFRGHFRSRAAAAVAGATLPVLTLLADHSLVRRAEPGSFAVLDVLRRYAEEKLHAQGSDATRVAERHATYYLELLAGAEVELASIGEFTAAARLQPEIDQIRAAWAHALRARTLGPVAASARAYFLFLCLLGWCEEGYAAFHEATLALATDSGRASAALESELYLGVFSSRLGFLPEAEARLSKVLTEFERSAEWRHAAFAGQRLGSTLLEAGRPEEARVMYERSLNRYRELGDERAIADLHSYLGAVATQIDRTDEALSLYAEAIAIQRRLDDRRGLPITLCNLGFAVFEQGRRDEAETHWLEGLRIAGAAGNLFASVFLLHNLSICAFKQGDLSGATALAERSLELSRRMGFRMRQADSLLVLGDIAMAHNEHAEADRLIRSAMSLLADSGTNPKLVEAKRSLAELERARGTLQKAQAPAVEVWSIQQRSPR